MPPETVPKGFSRRERQMMDLVYRLGRATAAEVREGLPDPPSYSAVRATLRILVEKGHLEHVQEGPRYVYLPTESRDKAARSAVTRLVETFFGGSRERAMAALMDLSGPEPDADQLARLQGMIDRARKEGR